MNVTLEESRFNQVDNYISSCDLLEIQNTYTGFLINLGEESAWRTAKICIHQSMFHTTESSRALRDIFTKEVIC